jgi:twitching motility protein PilT
LQGVFCQRLLPRKEGRGRVLACEVLIATPAVRSLIREEKVHQIYTQMQAGRSLGMQTMNMSLANLVFRRLVSVDVALEYSPDPKDLKTLLERDLSKISTIR